MSILSLALSWDIRRPPTGEANEPVWLTELAELRGRVLYAGGRRMRFRQSNGGCIDRDPFDRHAYHVLLRNSHRLIGCIRLIPLKNVQRCRTEVLVGLPRFEQVLVELGVTRHRVAEVGRWVIAPEFAACRMGMRLVAGVGNLAIWLGLEAVVAVVGTRDGQARALMRAGGRPVPGIPPIASEEYDDEVLVLTFDLVHPPSTIRTMAADMDTWFSTELGDEVGVFHDEVMCPVYPI